MDFGEIIKAGMAEYGYKQGREDEKNEWIGLLMPETMEVTIRLRDKDDNVEYIRTTVSFEEIKRGRDWVIEKLLKDTFLKIATQGIIEKLLWNKCSGNCPNVCKVHGGQYEFCSNPECKCHRRSTHN